MLLGIGGMAPTPAHLLLFYSCFVEPPCYGNRTALARFAGTHAATFKTAAKTLLPRMLAEPPDERDTGIHIFKGSKYGVKANVFLDFDTREADVELRGIVLGGTISGRGRLKNKHSESGGVLLEPSFRKKLARRGVTIVSASLDRNAMTVTVVARVIVVGRISITLSSCESCSPASPSRVGLNREGS